MNEVGFLDFYIAALITGSILGMDRELLKKAAVRFLPVSFLSMAVAALMAGIVGILAGQGFRETVLYIAMPMMSGGMGAGVVPLSNIYADALGLDKAQIISRMIPASTIGNVLDYICRTRRALGTMPEHPVAVTTIVSTDMATPVAKKYGVELRRTLTGFKFIGEQIGLLEAAGEADRYIFGFEESYGYLSGAHVRDKDAVNATLLVCEAAAWYAKQGMTLLDAINRLYAEFGCYRNALHSFAFEGESGMHTGHHEAAARDPAAEHRRPCRGKRAGIPPCGWCQADGAALRHRAQDQGVSVRRGPHRGSRRCHQRDPWQSCR